RRGHLFTQTNPVRARRKYSPTLALENYDLSEADLDTVFRAGQEIGIGQAKLRDILDHLNQTYCQSIGAEYFFIRDPVLVNWLQTKMELSKNTPHFEPEEKRHFYHLLKQAVGFESFIHKKFVGQKRFSLEGAEGMIPALDAVIERGSELGIEEFVIGMAHRGRLNVLANILRKPYENIFREFSAKEYDEENALGDVKYHLGYNTEITSDTGKKILLNLVPNPSHLETVGPVVQGLSRAFVRQKYGRDFNKLAAIIIHGDAAIASQGVVYETIQMSQLDGYKTGGTIHIVINNQVGFTTNYLDARSSTYCTDIAKVTKSPIFHVNGDDLEAIIYTIQFAMEFRQTFHQDVFIDILCYRKYGHNEGDEPRFTQPTLYSAIAKHPNPRDIYSRRLIEQGIYSREEISKAENEFDDLLNSKLEIALSGTKVRIESFLRHEWKGFKYARNADFFKRLNTGVPKKKLFELSEKFNTLPVDKKFFSKAQKIVEDRKNMISTNKVDWALAELLAYATLLTEGHPVRVSGQDTERGTFAHRHAAFVVEDSDEKYFPLKHLQEGQAPFHIFNSPLSEYGVLGFEYGYAMGVPHGLTIWEAQFGDFHNVAQVIIDQYISSAEEKWGLMNGLVLFLPHGFEGQGPEHSSARIERFLVLCAGNNMNLAIPTTPANFFHLLRRHVKRDFRVPLVVFTPKSLLRHPSVVSSLDELESGYFQEIIDDATANPETITQVVCTFGKLYYELVEKRTELGANDTAIVRIEQLFPFPADQLRGIQRKYKNARRWIWAQDEPENMGAWSFVSRVFKEIPFLLVSRPASGSPAAGLAEIHRKRLRKILDKVFHACTCEKAEGYCGMDCMTYRTSDLAVEVSEHNVDKNI
ncbi:MAG TPA: 2-oxoglutarate dehydrogenase E1 component, partial [Bacteroidales bacterium]|nr:2-oxoglutarate dehydrogenase E1 component [Bacteroidales bacterium]